MNHPKELLFEVATAVLANSRFRKYTYNIQDGRIRHNMLGGEVRPKLEKGVILAHRDGWYIQKTSVNSFSAHLASLLPCPLNVGDKVEIQHAGFAGVAQKDGDETSIGFRCVTLSRQRLESPVQHPLLQDMTDQLSEMKLPDGRRGMHLLSDLKFSNFRGGADNALTFNPYLQFEVTGAKFTGSVRMELTLGADSYALHFIGPDATVTVENVVLFDTLGIIEEHCDSSLARFAEVTILSRAKVPKTAPVAPTL